MLTFDPLARLQPDLARLEVAEAQDLLIQPETVVITELGTKLKVRLQVAGAELDLLVTPGDPLDLHILTPDLLPPHILDSDLPPEDPSLVSLLRWLVDHMRTHHRSLFADRPETEGLDGACERLQSMQMEGMSFECVLDGDRVTLLVKQMLELTVPLSSITNLLQEDLLVRSGGHHLLMKLGFSREGFFVLADSGVQLSHDLSNMLPDLRAVVKPGMEGGRVETEDLVDFIFSVKETLVDQVEDAVKGWSERMKFIFHLWTCFEEEESVAPFIDDDSMTLFVLCFTCTIYNYQLKMKLDTSFPVIPPSFELFAENKEDFKIKRVKWTAEKFGLEQGMTNDDIVDVIVEKIENIVIENNPKKW